ncbi:Transcription initiation factor TFIID subunit 7, partial [Stegodyphus mimosarum]
MIDEAKKTGGDAPVELESQFILRLPPTPAAALRAAVRSGVMNLEDRLAIQLEADMRHATVQFDKWTLPAKLYDLPTIIESCKTLDRKIFYKTADISQIMIAHEDAAKSDEEISPKKKDKDAKDKRYILPYGLTAPLKNVRKRRFRKTLKKKYVDLPDVEKEVKRLLRTDTEAISVKYEVVNAEDEKSDIRNNDRDFSVEGPLSLEERELSNSQTADVAEYDIFGEVLSSSEESAEEDDVNVVDVAEKQANRKLESITEEQEKAENDEEIKGDKEIMDLSKSMQLSPETAEQFQDQEYGNENDSIAVSQLESATAGENLGQLLKEQKTEEERMALMEKLDELEHTISNLQAKRRSQELEIMSIENQALRQRFQANIDRLKQDEYEKQMEYNEIMSILHDN